FARADEELRAAREAGIAVEIVPGITTATAAAATIGASLTKRGVARRVQFVTGHDVDGRLPRDLDLAALADATATTCVYMGKATFPALVAQLIARGLSAATPAVMVESLGSDATNVEPGSVSEIAPRLPA
ncbi:uroporphyrinogen-III C-methyltransferase, partial [Rhodopseudomonas sp. BR0C11]|uniref:SAM-dependent methyltransferase n=1 Tax=Rhodopseudomonas sp. BR0C11 TaxID=2269370 RepID=UPI001EC24F92